MVLDENSNLNSVFENSIKNINSKIYFGRINNTIDNENFEKSVKDIQKETNDLLKFYYGFEEKLRKEKDAEKVKKLKENLMEIVTLLKNKKEQIIRFKLKSKSTKTIVNIEDRIECALKALTH